MTFTTLYWPHHAEGRWRARSCRHFLLDLVVRDQRQIQRIVHYAPMKKRALCICCIYNAPCGSKFDPTKAATSL